jgi:hypothetical protein
MKWGILGIDLEMEMRSGSESSHPNTTDHGTLFHYCPFSDLYRREVEVGRVDGLDPSSDIDAIMAYDDELGSDSVCLDSSNYDTISHSEDWRTDRCSDIDPVVTPIVFSIVESIAPHVLRDIGIVHDEGGPTQICRISETDRIIGREGEVVAHWDLIEPSCLVLVLGFAPIRDISDRHRHPIKRIRLYIGIGNPPSIHIGEP